MDATSIVAQGPRLSKEIRMPPLKAFMDDMTIAVPNEGQAHVMLSRLDKLIRWYKMSFKPKKSYSLSIVRDKVVAISFLVADQPIPNVSKASEMLLRWIRKQSSSSRKQKTVCSILVGGDSWQVKELLPLIHVDSKAPMVAAYI